MEDMIHRNTDESKELGIENLEDVSGGAGKVTPEQAARFLELRKKFFDAREAYENGTGSQAELDAARDEMLAHVKNN